MKPFLLATAICAAVTGAVMLIERSGLSFPRFPQTPMAGGAGVAFIGFAAIALLVVVVALAFTDRRAGQ